MVRERWEKSEENERGEKWENYLLFSCLNKERRGRLVETGECRWGMGSRE
jgi:hypothetical protein